ncbi:MAG: gfo/Idh/MocA family oxidoreductase, partial [Planctomycetota bacterium]
GAPAEPPAQLDWDLWLGPAAARPYSSGVHPAHWRRFWDFGTGTVGDMACHWLDLVHWALELGAPTRVEVDGPEPDPVGTPPWMVARWTYARAGGGAPVEVAWFDGGKRPEDVELDHCHVWRGTRGRLVSTYGSLEVILDDPDEVWTPPEPTLAASPGHYVEWLDAIRDEAPGRPLCGFEYAAPLTEAVLLSTVAFRAGEAIDWDAEKGVGSAGEEFLSTPERDGWNV